MTIVSLPSPLSYLVSLLRILVILLIKRISRDLRLADFNPSSRNRIDVLIGTDIYGTILLDGLRRSSTDTLVAQHTIFGWILFGSSNWYNDSNYSMT